MKKQKYKSEEPYARKMIKGSLLVEERKRGLIEAVKEGNYERCEKLLSKGADPNKLSNGLSPLMAAAIKGDTKIGKLLLKHNADVDLIGKDRNTAMHYAAQHKHWRFLEMLLKTTPFPDPRIKNKEGKDVLAIAKENGAPEKVIKKIGHIESCARLREVNRIYMYKWIEKILSG
ncbi:MAG: ankyrin repeat domain-containing protein [Candidatus Anstonellales archaeon]